MRDKAVPKRSSSGSSSSSAQSLPLPLLLHTRSCNPRSSSLAALPSRAPSADDATWVIAASRQLLMDLPPDILQTVLCQLLAPDLAALSMSCTTMSPPCERAARATVDSLLTGGTWPTPLHDTETRSWKETLAYATAFIEGRRGCLAAGEAHTLLLSRRLRRLLPGEVTLFHCCTSVCTRPTHVAALRDS